MEEKIGVFETPRLPGNCVEELETGDILLQLYRSSSGKGSPFGRSQARAGVFWQRYKI